MARLLDDGANQYCSRTFTGAWADLIPMSISCWFYLDDLTVSQHLVGFSLSGAPQDYVRLMYNSAGTIQAQHYTLADGQDSASLAFNTANEMHHVVGIFRDASYRAIFLDGSATTDSDSTVNSVPTLDRTSVGALVLAAVSQYLSGGAAEIAIWAGHELANNEIDALAAGVSPMLVYPQACSYYWTALDADSPLHDWSSFENPATGERQDLTVINGPIPRADHPRIIYPNNCGGIIV